MSDQIFNQNSNSIKNNNEIDMKEQNADSNKINAVFGMERRVFKFKLNPSLLATNLFQYFEKNPLFKPGDLKNNAPLREIIDKIDYLSNNIVNIIKDFKEKFDNLGYRIYEYTLIKDKKVGSNENKINNLQSGLIKIHELIDASNKRINAIEDFKNNIMAYIENVVKIYYSKTKCKWYSN